MQDITAKELKTKLDNKENFTLIDVREIHENAEFNFNVKKKDITCLTGLKY